MAHKQFSITKAFEFGFDMLVHHHYIFLQFTLVVGGLALAGHYVNKHYVNPYVRDAFALIKERAKQSAWAQKLEVDTTHYEAPEVTKIKKWVGRFLNSNGGIISVTTIRKEVGTGVVEQVSKKIVVPADQVKNPVVPLHSLLPYEKRAIALGLFCLILSYIAVVFITLLSLRLGISFYSFHTINIAHALRLTLHLLPVGLLAIVFYELIVALGCLLLIFPGIILALRYSQIIPLLADERAITVREAFGMSGQCTDGAKWHLLFFSILVCIIHRFAAYLGWGLLLSAPILSLAAVHVYYQLLEQTPNVLTEGHCEATIGA